MNILNKIRSLSKKKKKFILWLVMLIVTVFLLSFYVQGIKNTLKENEEKEFFGKSYFQELQEQVSGIREKIFNNVKTEE